MPKIKKNEIEQCTQIFIYRDLKAEATMFTCARANQA